MSKIETIGVLGGGVMGAGIAQAMARPSHTHAVVRDIRHKCRRLEPTDGDRLGWPPREPVTQCLHQTLFERQENLRAALTSSFLRAGSESEQTDDAEHGKRSSAVAEPRVRRWTIRFPRLSAHCSSSGS